MTTPTGFLDADHDALGWQECIACGGTPTWLGFTQLPTFPDDWSPTGEPPPRRETWARIAWCSSPECVDDRAGTSPVVARQGAAQAAANLAATAARAEREAARETPTTVTPFRSHP